MMSEENVTLAAATAEPPSAPPVESPSAPPAAPKAKNVQKKRRRKKIRNGIIAAVVVAALAVGGFFLFKFLNKTEEVDSQLQTATADWGSITSSVQGSGNARSKESAAITLQNAGIVQNLYVTEGQIINEGDPLYEIVSPAAQEAYNAAVKTLEDAQDGIRDTAAKNQRELELLQAALTTAQKDRQRLLTRKDTAETERFIKAPFAGQLQEVTRYNVGDHVAGEPKVATLVDDTRFRVPFYFSYAYEGKIQVGQKALVTVSGSDLEGQVEEVNMVRRVSQEGSLLFEVIVVVPNPGALTKGQTANASLTGADGVPIYPYDAGTLDYYRTTDIYAKTEGDVVSSLLRDFVDVTAGQTLLTLSPQDFSEELEAADKAILAAQDAIQQFQNSVADSQEAEQERLVELQQKVEETQKALEDFSAVAPISGTVTYCSLAEGQEVKGGETVMTISNNTTMIVTINVDDRNISYVKPGMGVELTSGWGEVSSFYGVVTKIDMSLSDGSIGSGMTNYPVTLEVDNFDGSLMDGMWLSYSFVTSQSDNCIVVPMQSVKYISTEDGGTASVIFIQSDTRPDNAIDVDVPEVMPGQAPQYPSQADGYYAVPVTTGLADNYNVEVKEGLMGGETIFVNYYVTQASSWN